MARPQFMPMRSRLQFVSVPTAPSIHAKLGRLGPAWSRSQPGPFGELSRDPSIAALSAANARGNFVNPRACIHDGQAWGYSETWACPVRGAGDGQPEAKDIATRTGGETPYTR